MHEVAYRYRVLNTRRIHSREWKCEIKSLRFGGEPNHKLSCGADGACVGYLCSRIRALSSSMNKWCGFMHSKSIHWFMKTHTRSEWTTLPWPLKNMITFSTTFDSLSTHKKQRRVRQLIRQIQWAILSTLNLQVTSTDACYRSQTIVDIPSLYKWIYCGHKQKRWMPKSSKQYSPVFISVVYWLQTYPCTVKSVYTSAQINTKPRKRIAKGIRESGKNLRRDCIRSHIIWLWMPPCLILFNNNC